MGKRFPHKFTDGVYRCIKIHPDQTITHVKVLTGKRDDYVTLSINT